MSEDDATKLADDAETSARAEPSPRAETSARAEPSPDRKSVV